MSVPFPAGGALRFAQGQKSTFNPNLGDTKGKGLSRTDLLSIMGRDAKNKSNNTLRLEHLITHNDYRKLATLKLAGRTDDSIAKIYGMTVSNIKPHIYKALVEFRRKKLNVDMHEVTQEAKKLAEEKEFNLLHSSELAADATGDFLSAIEPPGVSVEA